MSEDFAQQFKGQAKLPSGGASSEAVKRAKRELQPRTYTEPTYYKTLGAEVLIAGRCGKSDTKPKPKVSGGCMFNQPEAYAQEILKHEQVA